MSDLSQQIETDATKLAGATSPDTGSIQRRSLTELIAADKHLQGSEVANQEGNAGTNNGRRGITFLKLRRGGTV